MEQTAVAPVAPDTVTAAAPASTRFGGFSQSVTLPAALRRKSSSASGPAVTVSSSSGTDGATDEADSEARRGSVATSTTPPTRRQSGYPGSDSMATIEPRGSSDSAAHDSAPPQRPLCMLMQELLHGDDDDDDDDDGETVGNDSRRGSGEGIEPPSPTACRSPLRTLRRMTPHGAPEPAYAPAPKRGAGRRGADAVPTEMGQYVDSAGTVVPDGGDDVQHGITVMGEKEVDELLSSPKFSSPKFEPEDRTFHQSQALRARPMSPMLLLSAGMDEDPGARSQSPGAAAAVESSPSPAPARHADPSAGPPADPYSPELKRQSGTTSSDSAEPGSPTALPLAMPRACVALPSPVAAVHDAQQQQGAATTTVVRRVVYVTKHAAPTPALPTAQPLQAALTNSPNAVALVANPSLSAPALPPALPSAQAALAVAAPLHSQPGGGLLLAEPLPAAAPMPVAEQLPVASPMPGAMLL